MSIGRGALSCFAENAIPKQWCGGGRSIFDIFGSAVPNICANPDSGQGGNFVLVLAGVVWGFALARRRSAC